MLLWGMLLRTGWKGTDHTTQIQTGSMWEWVRAPVLKELFIMHQLPHADFISG